MQVGQMLPLVAIGSGGGVKTSDEIAMRSPNLFG
jgi:hypothetical protein